MHYWGDDWPYWDDLDAAGKELGNFCRRWGRFGGQIKEKYGTLRFYANFHFQLHDLIYPGHYFLRYKSMGLLGTILHWVDYEIYLKGTKYVPLQVPIRWYQSKIYQYGYRRIIKKYPHIKEEILRCADHPGLLNAQ